MAHGKYVYVAPLGEEPAQFWRWECAACGKSGKYVPTKAHAMSLGQRHSNKFGPKVLKGDS